MTVQDFNHRSVLGFLPGPLSLVWGRLLAQHSEKLKLLVPFSKSKFCGRSWYRSVTMKKMEAWSQADFSSDP